MTIDEVIARVPGWSGRQVRQVPITGGLSHQVVRVEVDGHSYVLRVLDPAVSEAGLGIPLRQEIDNTVRAAESGVGPQVLHVLEDPPAVVLEFLSGPTLGAADVRRPVNLPRIAAACRRLHGAPRAFVNGFDIFAKQRQLLALTERHGLRVPPDYRDYLPVAERVCRVLAAAPLPAVPCHNDLLAENFIDAGGVVRIVDYQLSGMNDPAFELGNIAAESQLDPEGVEVLVRAYFGAEYRPALLARVRLMLMMSNFTWTLWFCVHHGLLSRPDIGFDYWGEADSKWGRARAALTGPELSGWLAEVCRV